MHNFSQWLLVIILFLLFVGIIVFAILNPNENGTSTSNSNLTTTQKITEESVAKANEQYKGYSDYIVTPKRTNYTIEQISTKDNKIYIKLLDSEIFSKSENDSTYGIALGNTMSLLMKDFFPSNTIIIIECGDNIVFTGNIL